MRAPASPARERRAAASPISSGVWVARRGTALASAWWWVRRQRADAAVALQAVARRLCAGNGLEIQRRGPLPPEGCVVVANHLSYVDALVVPSLVPCTCIAKREVAGWPIIGPITRRLGVLFVDRDSPYSGAVVLRQAERALRSGVAVVAFPEGTTTAGNALLLFRRGVFELARRLGVRVVAAALWYDDRDVAWTGTDPFIGHYLRGVASRRRTVVRVSLSAPLDPRAWSSAAAMAQAVRAHIAAELAPHLALGAAASGRPVGPQDQLADPVLVSLDEGKGALDVLERAGVRHQRRQQAHVSR
jgi:lyso-ornithine lipid O-acyltransferase